MRTAWHAKHVILVGHSGGAAVAADVAAQSPGLISHVFLVSCPCDVNAFRRHMARSQWSPLWLLPSRSISPLVSLNGLQKDVAITAISGSLDPVALPSYAELYVEKARQLGLVASMVLIDGKGHEILNDPRTIAEVEKAAIAQR